jgi:hypothetical protein
MPMTKSIYLSSRVIIFIVASPSLFVILKEPFTLCHSEGAERLKNLTQNDRNEGLRMTGKGTGIAPSLCSWK